MDSITITDIAVHIILLFTGLTGNAFILAVHFLEWLKTRDLNPCNLIINGISISNIFLQITNDFTEITYCIFPEAALQHWVINVTFALTSSLALSSLWCSTCLCFYYCVKIADFKGAVFYKLKAKLPVTVPWLLVFSGVVSWGSGMPAVWSLYIDISTSALNATSNLTLITNMLYKSKCNCTFQIHLFVASMAFVIIFLTAGMILTSLCKHILQMKQNNEGFGRPKVRAHLSAAKKITALLILYLIFFAIFIYSINSTLYMDSTSTIVCTIVFSLFPTINVLILIMGNRKYLDILKKFMCMESNEMK